MIVLKTNKIRTTSLYELMKLCDANHINIYWSEMLWYTGKSNTWLASVLVDKLNEKGVRLVEDIPGVDEE